MKLREVGIHRKLWEDDTHWYEADFWPDRRTIYLDVGEGFGYARHRQWNGAIADVSWDQWAQLQEDPLPWFMEAML